MAIRYAVANGNWSALSTWDGGASLPDSGDDVYANNKTVTIDQNVTVLSVRTTAGGSAVAGGGFTLGAGYTLTADVIAGTTTAVSASFASPGAATVVGNVTGGTSGSALGINFSGAGTFTVTGNVVAGSAVGMNNGGAGIINLIGNATGSSSAVNTPGVQNGSNGTVNITGNVTGGTLAASYGASNSGGGTVNITGNVYAGVGTFGSINISTGTLNVYGEAVGNPTAAMAGVQNNSTGNCYVQVSRASDYPNSGSTVQSFGTLQNVAGGSILIDAMVFGSGGAIPVSGRHFVRNAGTNYVTMRESNAGPTLNMGELAADYPSQANVRSGISFDFGNKTGSCAVPPAGSVAFGVPVGATTGTAVLGGGITAADVWAYAARSLTDKAGFAPSAAAIAAQVRTELTTELARIDQAVSAAKTLTGAYDAAKASASSAELGAAVSFILANLPAGITPADVWAHVSRTLTESAGLSPTLTARLENCATVQSTGDQIAALGV